MITAAALFGCAAKSDKGLEKLIEDRYEDSKGYVTICNISMSNAERTTDYTVKATSVFGDYTEISFLKPDHLKEFTLVYSKGCTTAKLNGKEVPLLQLPDGVSVSSILPENWLYLNGDEEERTITMDYKGNESALLEMKKEKVKYRAHIDVKSGSPLILEASDNMDKKLVCDYQSFDYTR
jgi:hypothetical protein